MHTYILQYNDKSTIENVRRSAQNTFALKRKAYRFYNAGFLT